MTSQDKLIKQGINYTDALFKEIENRLIQGMRMSDTLEEFVANLPDDYEVNPLLATGYKDKMVDLILQETNNHKFSRPSQKELTRVTIENQVGDLIVDVGEDIRDSVREIVKDGYNNNLSQQEIAENISSKVTSIRNTRARVIARTEIARTATISDYVINAERGATHFYVECRNTACPICKKAWHEGWTEENDSTFTPRNSSAGNKGWIGDKVYSMNDTAKLPPIHPNCYDSETEVFTDHGWKYFHDITEQDKILSLNPETNETAFLEYVKLIQVPNVHGKLYHIHNKWFDICVTPDHDCFIHQRRDGGKRGKYLEPQFRKPSELNSESRFVRCIDTDRENPQTVNVNGLEFKPEDYAFFMAWYISEGSVLHNPETAKAHAYPVKITQEITENREIIEPVFRNISEYLGIKLAVGKSYFEFYSKDLYDYLVRLGKSHEKYIPNEVFLLDKDCLNVFLDVYVLGDGHERTESNDLVTNSNERILFTSSKQLRDDLSYLILLCGFYPSIGMHTREGTVSNHSNGVYTQNHDVYSIRINKSQYTNFSSCTVDEIEYCDTVYCVELPKWHTLWVKRNGKTSWNGNCRCVPYFVSEDEIPKGAVIVKDTTTTTTTQVPTDEQLKATLTKQDLEMVDWAKSVLENPNLGEKQKTYAQKRLDELYEKATGETPKTKTKKKTKPAEEPVTETKTQTNPIENMTSQELYDSMTKADKKKYDKAKQKLATVEKNLKTIGENDLLLGMKKDRLLEIHQLEQKQRDKLQNKGKRKPKEKVVRTHERTLDNIHDDIDIPVKKLIPSLEKWIDKRCKNTSEFGYHFNIKDGSIIDGLKDGEIRGVKGHIAMRDLGAETGSIHSHPRNGMSAPSIADLETFRCKQQDHHFMVSEHEIWYVHATDRFGIGAMGQQLDLQKAHKECRDRAFKKVETEIKKGNIEATEEAIAKKLHEYTGDEILKTFNSPPWNKTMTVKRYYR